MYTYDKDDKDNVVCECLQLTKGELIEAVVNEDLKSVEEMQDSTQAGTICGSCVEPGLDERPEYLVDILKEGRTIKDSL